ncbi:MAG: hypothetical protein JNM00_14850, partial [Flavobacteriales bacterium]|nr:hypothetical protein [Flavobacteriales bacterium]
MKHIILGAVLLSSVANQCGDKVANTSAKTGGPMTVMFYNVENLFDTVNDPSTLDDDFTPEGKLNWTDERYRTHLAHTAWVIDALPGDLPALIGVCEIENRKVLEDLISASLLSGKPYGIVHRDSPDERGIDVGLMYDRNQWELVNESFIEVVLPSSGDPNTRDILHAQLRSGGNDLHVFVNHWPSRREGEKESEPNRLTAARAVRDEIDKLLAGDKNAAVLVMGDFNDYPDNRSTHEVLCGGQVPLTNLM